MRWCVIMPGIVLGLERCYFTPHPEKGFEKKGARIGLPCRTLLLLRFEFVRDLNLVDHVHFSLGTEYLQFDPSVERPTFRVV